MSASQTETHQTGQWTPIADELDCEVEVIGDLPHALRGTYVRNGPNPQFPPEGEYHAFDGDGMVHSVTLDPGGPEPARYRNRWIESAALLAERKRGEAIYGGLGHFREVPPEVVAEAGMFKNNGNTSVLGFDGRLLALMEGGAPYELDPVTLATRGEYDFGGDLPFSFTAHPKVDPVSGDVWAFAYMPVEPYLTAFLAREGRLVRQVPISIPNPVMMHDFVVTEHHLVFFDLPAIFDLNAWMQGENPVRWEPEVGARVGILPKDATTDETQWIEIDPCYVFHFMSGWEGTDGRIVVNGCRADVLPTAFDENEDRVLTPVNLHRWEIDPSAGSVSVRPIDDLLGDFPQIAPNSLSRPHRHGYLSGTSEWGLRDVVWDRMGKVDLVDGGHAELVLPEGSTCGEAFFVDDPDRPAEDGGWLLNWVSDHSAGRSELWVLDAESFDPDPIARVVAPRRVPQGFHGTWLQAGP